MRNASGLDRLGERNTPTPLVNFWIRTPHPPPTPQIGLMGPKLPIHSVLLVQGPFFETWPEARGKPRPYDLVGDHGYAARSSC